MTARLRVRGWITAVLDGTVDGAFLAPLRVTLGALLFWHAIVGARELLGLGYFGDAFHTSLLPEGFTAEKSVFMAVVAARAVLAALVIVGVRARPALLLSGLLVLYTLATNTLDFHHNRYSLALYAILLSLTPCDRAWLLLGDAESDRDGSDDATADGGGFDVPREGGGLGRVETVGGPPSGGDRVRLVRGRGRGRGRDRIGLGFGVWLCRVQVAIVYLASGTSKLLDADWRAGTVLRERFAMFGGEALAHGVPRGVVDALGSTMGSSVLAKVAIVTEIAIAILLFFRRTKAPAIWLGLGFHLAIQLTSRVEVFSVLAIAMYVVFVEGDVRARSFRYDPRSTLATWLAKVVRATDWLARFDVKPWEPDGLTRGHVVVVVRRDGSRATRLAAFAMVARGIPLFFLFWAPLALATSFTKGGDVGTEA